MNYFMLITYLSQVSSDLWGLLGILLIIILGFSALIFWLWILSSILENLKLKPTAKFLWIVLILTTYFGSVVYFFAHNPKIKRSK